MKGCLLQKSGCGLYIFAEKYSVFSWFCPILGNHSWLVGLFPEHEKNIFLPLSFLWNCLWKKWIFYKRRKVAKLSTVALQDSKFFSVVHASFLQFWMEIAWILQKFPKWQILSDVLEQSFLLFVISISNNHISTWSKICRPETICSKAAILNLVIILTCAGKGPNNGFSDLSFFLPLEVTICVNYLQLTQRFCSKHDRKGTNKSAFW